MIGGDGIGDSPRAAGHEICPPLTGPFGRVPHHFSAGNGGIRKGLRDTTFASAIAAAADESQAARSFSFFDRPRAAENGGLGFFEPPPRPGPSL